MTADGALQQFVADNLQFLSSEQFARDEYKRLHRACFVERHNKRFGMPNLKDVATKVVKLLLSRGIAAAKVAAYIDDLPLFRDLGDPVRTTLKAMTTSGQYKSRLTAEDFQTLQNASAFEAVERHRGKEIEEQTRRQIVELEGKIKNKQEEYTSLPSVLDEKEYTEPDFDPALEEVKSWWERFYLKSNPFPRKDGLSAVDTDLYESVVVKTEPFKRILGNLSRNPDCLFNTAFLLVGDFGFGKTTFIDYLRYYFVRQDVLPLRITCGKSHVTASGFIDAFYVTFATYLRAEIKSLNLPLPSSEGMELEDTLIELCRTLMTRKRGIIVFLDDYHKHQSATAAVFEFLGLLQILKDNMTRAHLKVGFVVSGLVDWVAQLATHTQMSGFLDSPSVVMPPITPDMIAAVFNQRIRAYCYDTKPRTLP